MRPLLAALLTLAMFTVTQAQTEPIPGDGGYPGASFDYNPEPPGTYVRGCTRCLGPDLTRQTDCFELISQRGGCAEMATEQRAEWTALANPPTLTIEQCDEYLHVAGGKFLPPSCAAFATEVAVGKENWRATVGAFLAPRETEIAASGESGYCYSERRAGFVGVGCATPTPEEDN